jgi:hypothetical protein
LEEHFHSFGFWHERKHAPSESTAKQEKMTSASKHLREYLRFGKASDGYILLQDQELPVSLRNIKIRELTPINRLRYEEIAEFNLFRDHPCLGS